LVIEYQPIKNIYRTYYPVDCDIGILPEGVQLRISLKQRLLMQLMPFINPNRLIFWLYGSEKANWRELKKLNSDFKKIKIANVFLLWYFTTISNLIFIFGFYKVLKRKTVDFIKRR
jgi:hypothetical protein